MERNPSHLARNKRPREHSRTIGTGRAGGSRETIDQIVHRAITSAHADAISSDPDVWLCSRNLLADADVFAVPRRPTPGGAVRSETHRPGYTKRYFSAFYPLRRHRPSSTPHLALLLVMAATPSYQPSNQTHRRSLYNPRVMPPSNSSLP